VTQLRSSRTWIATIGPKRRKMTTLVFVLARASRVVFTVQQVSPDCRGIGHFTVRGHEGVNRVPFRGRVHGKPLAPGTYRISVRTPKGRVVRRIVLVIVQDSAPSRAELRSLRAANTCPTPTSSTIATSALGLASGGNAVGEVILASPKTSGLGAAPGSGPNVHSGVLGSVVEKTARALQPLFIALLALAILLLAVASLPQFAVPDPRLNDLLARHRGEIAALGATALLAVALTFLLS
jgi:hypothetical protein